MARVFSGARPTGRQHLGNYLGAIQNYVKLQEEHDCFYCVVDIHALTTLEETRELQGNIHEMVLDWLAAGMDPHKSTMFVQSHVPEVMELYTLLSMVTPLGWLLRVPTFKEKARQQPENVNYGLVGYPVLMASDIVLYKGEMVPVGEDQLPHLELTREIVRRFNSIFGPTFPEPKALLTETPLVLGTDRQKMSKSLNNHVELAATLEETTERVKRMITDPDRPYRNQPGHPDNCNVYTLEHYFAPDHLERVYKECTTATLGCVENKTFLAAKINGALAPFRERRRELASNNGFVREVLGDGASRASDIARETLKEVKERMNLQ
ncbi:MAG: tryptophan--tRNA ligase [Dehalococcoidia bacterium]|jgi:tryptophanyl-tRNA synthetase|nr:tryptophan--tRNA ligase [Dehalococcoidia bacterium]